MTGLRSRDVTGKGQVVEASLLRTATWTISLDLVTSLVDGQPAYNRPREKGLSAMLEAFQASDGRWLQFAMPDTGDAWERFCRALDREDLLTMDEFSSGRLRYQNMPQLLATIDESVGSMPADHWMPRLDEHRCIWAPINDSAAAVQDPQVRATGAFETIHHPVVGDFETVAAPFRLHDAPNVGVKGPAPEKGEHTDQVLRELLHLSEEEIEALESGGVVHRG
jgi:crotonobetainyl-CoA:carnitine CoA-transferase CaiB-like acyl-CoA transferase